MRPYFLTALVAVLCIHKSNAQETFQHEWSFNLEASGDSEIHSVAVDSNNDAIVAGQFQGSMDLDPGIGSANVSVVGGAAFISKFDNNGNYLFGQYFSSDQFVETIEVLTDFDNNFYLIGNYTGTIDFSTIPGGTSVSYTSAGFTDLFIAKCSPNGDLLWANSFGGGNGDFISGIAITPEGDIVVTGGFKTTVDFNPDPNVTESLTSLGGHDIFIAKYATTGALIWAKHIGGVSSEWANDIEIQSGGDIYLTGGFLQTVDFNPDLSVNYDLTSAGGRDIFILKLDPSGQFVWAHGIGGGQDDESYALAITSNGDLIYTGTYDGAVDFDPGAGSTTLTSGLSYDLFISKLNAAGDFQWAARSLSDTYIAPYAISLDQADNAFLTGYFYGTVDLDPDGSNFAITTSTIDDNIFISQWNSSGQFKGASVIEGSYFGEGYSIAHNNDDQLLAAGFFNGTADFDPSNALSELMTANQSAFLFKWSTCPDKPQVSINVETLSCTSTDVNYTWLDCDNNYSAIAGETNQTFTPTANGNYAVMVDNGFCSDTSDCVVIDFISVDELDQMKISIAPNPTNSNVTVYFKSVAKNAVVEVYDALGQLIGVQQTKHSQQQTIELPRAKGVYFVHVSIDDAPVIVRRVIKR